MLLLVLAIIAPSQAPRLAPNLWGQAGVMHIESARVPGTLGFDVAAAGFVLAVPDYLVPVDDDFNALVGGQLAASAAFFDVFEVALACRSASNTNNKIGASAFSVGDLYPSLKLGFTFLPVAVGLDVRTRLPTRVDAAGLDVSNVGITTQGLVTLDLNDGMNIPVRAHLNAGYTFENGKYSAVASPFEANPNFYDGIDGALLALASDSWFYDQVTGGLALEVPLPFVTPFVEVSYRAAVGVPANRGAAGAAYDLAADSHLTITPGARITALDHITIDLGVDVAVLGTAGGGTDATKVVDGTPPNAPFLARFGVTSTFDAFAPSARSVSASADDVAALVQHGGTPEDAPTVSGRARVIGYVTNKEDETLDAELEVWDGGGSRAVGTSQAGAFDVPVQAGDVAIVARADGYLSEGVTLHVGDGGRARAGIVLKKLPKARKAVLEEDRIAVQTRVPFEFKKPRLQSTAEYVLADVVDVLLRNPALRVRVEVHAEPLAKPDDSQRLADERAAAVVFHLVQHGVWRARIEARGTPLDPAAADQGRRVDFIIVP